MFFYGALNSSLNSFATHPSCRALICASTSIIFSPPYLIGKFKVDRFTFSHVELQMNVYKIRFSFVINDLGTVTGILDRLALER